MAIKTMAKSTREYNATHPRVSIRLTESEKEQLQKDASDAGKVVSAFILERIRQTASDAGSKPSDNEDREDFMFMFKFFNNNKSKLEISTEERERFKKIYARVKQ